MNIYDSLLGAVHSEYDVLMLIKKSERGEVSLVRHRDSGTRYIFRHFYGNSEVYQKLLNVSCPNLPQIMEVGEKDGKTALLEEYVQGDTLSGGETDCKTALFCIVGISFYGYGAQRCEAR